MREWNARERQRTRFSQITPILFTQIDKSGYVIFSIVLRADRITITRFPFQRSNVGPRVRLLRCSKHASRENESIITHTQTQNKANMFYRVYVVSRIDRYSNKFLFGELFKGTNCSISLFANTWFFVIYDRNLLQVSVSVRTNYLTSTLLRFIFIATFSNNNHATSYCKLQRQQQSVQNTKYLLLSPIYI